MVLNLTGWLIIAAVFVIMIVAAHWIGVFTDPTRERRARPQAHRRA